MATGFIEWMFLDFREATIESQYGHLQVSRRGFHEYGTSDSFRFILKPGTGADVAKHVHELRSLAPRLVINGLISRDDATIAFTGEGLDAATDVGADDRSLRILTGKKLGPLAADQVLLGRGLSESLGATVGDTVVLLVNLPNGGINAGEVVVVGTFASVSRAYDDSALVLPIQTARKLLKVDGLHKWLVYLTDTRHTESAATRLRKELDPATYEVRTWDQLATFYTRAVALLRGQLDVVRAIVTTIILLGISNTMLMSVVERTGEIGTSMALGTKRGALLRSILAEGAVIGLTGAVTGVAMSLLLGTILSGLQIQMPPPPGLTRGYVARILFTPAAIVEACAIAIVSTALASVYPAWKASRMSIVDALRHNR
jgi:putative ABC transport system permease protein